MEAGIRTTIDLVAKRRCREGPAEAQRQRAFLLRKRHSNAKSVVEQKLVADSWFVVGEVEMQLAQKSIGALVNKSG